jgi:L-threonylcarbamoyladenylate synthase
VYVLDGGPCEGGIESTVVKLGDAVRILRAGLITPEQVEAVLGAKISVANDHRASDAPLESPGQLESHYAPVTSTRLIDTPDLVRSLSPLRHAVVLSHQAVDVPPPHRLITMPADARAYASSLYASLRAADAAHPEQILVVRPIPSGSPDERSIWLAVLDRLIRAAAAP